jgi:hypothetical protein
MYSIAPGIPLPPRPARIELANALELLRIADQRLLAASEAFDPDLDEEFSLGIHDLIEAQSLCWLFSRELQELVGDVLPSISDRAFRTIATWSNRIPWHLEHTEAVYLALRLARRKLAKALDIGEELEADVIHDGWRIVVACHRCVHSTKELFAGCMTPFSSREYRKKQGHDDDDLLAAIVAGKPVQPVQEYRMALLEDYRAFLVNHPDGTEYTPRSYYQTCIQQLEQSIEEPEALLIPVTAPG